MQFWHFVTIYYCFINALSIACFGLDKKKAEAGKWRVPERTLISLALIGGGIGALLGMLIFHHKTRKRKFRVFVPLWLLLHVIAVAFFTYQNNNLLITHYDMEEAGDLRIVQISDLHNVVLWWQKDYITDQVRDLSPDIIVITGDIVDSSHTDIDSAIYTAGELAKFTDTYYVTGNHEYWLDEEERSGLYSGLENCGVKILENDYEYLDLNGRRYALIGLDDKNLSDNTLKDIIADIDSDVETITLAHEPQNISNYAAAGTDYVITGHAHGGQMVLPGIGPLVAPDQGFGPEYTSGVVEENGTKMIISRGLGNSIIPVRLFDFPEIVVIDY